MFFFQYTQRRGKSIVHSAIERNNTRTKKGLSKPSHGLRPRGAEAYTNVAHEDAHGAGYPRLYVPT
jgi:hypothetical protein